MKEKACEKDGPNCGQCVRVLGVCEPNPAPVAVDKECIQDCLQQAPETNDCVMCVRIYATCFFGKGSTPEPIGKEENQADRVFDAVDTAVAEGLKERKDAPALPGGGTNTRRR